MVPSWKWPNFVSWSIFCCVGPSLLCLREVGLPTFLFTYRSFRAKLICRRRRKRYQHKATLLRAVHMRTSRRSSHREVARAPRSPYLRSSDSLDKTFVVGSNFSNEIKSLLPSSNTSNAIVRISKHKNCCTYIYLSIYCKYIYIYIYISFRIVESAGVFGKHQDYLLSSACLNLYQSRFCKQKYHFAIFCGILKSTKFAHFCPASRNFQKYIRNFLNTFTKLLTILGQILATLIELRQMCCEMLDAFHI